MPRKRVESSGFGERLAALRQDRGITQVQLAEETGLTQRAISYYENHHGFPPAPALVALAKGLHVTTDELLGVKAPKAERVDPEERRLWKKFQQIGDLPEKDQRAVIRLINSLAAAREAPASAAR